MVTLDGSGSTDVDGNVLTYNWAFTAKPVDSVATLSDATAPNPTFSLDKAGVYAVSLTVNDGTVTATVQVVATWSVSAAVTSVQNCINIVTLLNQKDFKNAHMQKTMINKLNAVIASIMAGKYEDALGLLGNDILGKTDGCATKGKPDNRPRRRRRQR